MLTNHGMFIICGIKSGNCIDEGTSHERICLGVHSQKLIVNPIVNLNETVSIGFQFYSFPRELYSRDTALY